MRPLFDNCARTRCHIIPAKPFERELCKNAVKKRKGSLWKACRKSAKTKCLNSEMRIAFSIVLAMAR